MQNLITNLKNNFLLYRLNYICRRFLTSSSIFNNILTSTKNSKNSKIMYQINTKESANYLVINNILLNQNLSVTKSKLEELLKVKGVEINLPVNSKEDKNLLDQLTGKSKYKGFFGVYIFIHKITGQKYVGSSNYLRRIMNYYFKGDFPLLIFTSSSKRRVRGF